MLEGECACKAVRYRLNAAPMFVQSCHCLNCQRQTGSAFVINILIEKVHVELLEGPARAGRRPTRRGPFSGSCAARRVEIAVWSFYTRAGIRFVRGGTLDEPSSVTPDVHIYTRSKLGWVMLPDSVPAFATYYDTEKLWPTESVDRLRAATKSKR